MATALNISISAEKIFSIAGLNVSNSMLTSLIVSGLLIGFAIWVRMSLKKTNRPSGIQNIAEYIVESLTGLVQSVTGNVAKTELFFPFIATLFLFILLNNWFGLLPGVGSIGFYEEEKEAHVEVVQSANTEAHLENTKPAETNGHTGSAEPVKNEEPVKTSVSTEALENTEASHKVFVPYFRAGTADLNMTISLGIIAVVLVQIVGVHYLSIGYFTKYINFSGPIQFFVGLLEIISEVSRIISFAFRLFGNIFAGEVLLLVIGALVPVIAPMPFYGLEIFVGFIQALVFAMLTTVFFNMASLGHGDEH